VRPATPCGTLRGVVFALLTLIGPLPAAGDDRRGLWSYGPLGWVASVLLRGAHRVRHPLDIPAHAALVGEHQGAGPDAGQPAEARRAPR
jgi:hypothetical protein